MTRSRTAGALVGGLVACLGLGACSSSDDVGAPPSPPAVTATPSPVSPDCASIYAGVNAGVLPQDATLESVTVCGTGAGGSTAIVTVTAQQDADALEQLADVLARPDAAVEEGIVCTMELRIVPDFVVVPVGGAPVAPRVPTDECGKPALEAVQILDAMLATAEPAG